MSSVRTRAFTVAGTLVTAFLANGLVHRGAIEMPAWQQTGASAWATFNRHADLSFPALLIYPTEAFAGAILTIGTVVSYRTDRAKPRQAAWPV